DGSALPQTAQRVEKQVVIPVMDTEGAAIILPTDYQPQTVGMKAYQLAKLDRREMVEGERAAQHVTLGFSLYQQILKRRGNRGMAREIQALMGRLQTGGLAAEDVRGILKELREKIESLRIPRDVLREIHRGIVGNVGKGLVFLRSSTNAEDLPDYAGAGLYDSYGAVNPQDLKMLEFYIKKVWASVWNERAYEDRALHGIPHETVGMAVLVQEMVPSDYSFVIHTRNPFGDGDADEMLLELVQGLGEALVSGAEEYEGSPHRFAYHRRTGVIRVLSYADKDHRLVSRGGWLVRETTNYADDFFVHESPERNDVLAKIFQSALRVEASFAGQSQDIEGALVRPAYGEAAPGGLVRVFLQSRNQQGVAETPLPAIAAIEEMATTSADPSATAPGGIDFDPSRINLQTRGQGWNFDVPLDLQNFSTIPFDGLEPVMLEMLPVDLRLLLGVSEIATETSG
ncbi:MAG: PEP/pyruvate-binding domain-containing protein, partial [Candidatus Omnitrophica bacterium]|nr:PEP/pyruvate-binding domain-containing protein [Candidatus Omnitrophota bacterium]